MRKITEVLRLKFEAKLSHEKIGRAVGLSGKDASMITCTMADPELGFVGEPSEVDTTLLRQLFEAEMIPVIAPIGADRDGHSYNINGDTAAGAIAAALKADRLLLLTDIEGVKGEIDDPKLPANSIDAAIMVDAYHEFSHPYEMIAGIYQALRPGGRIFLLEYRGEDASVPIRPLHKMTQAQVIKEMSVFGLQWTDTLDFLPWQHMMVFTKPE